MVGAQGERDVEVGDAHDRTCARGRDPRHQLCVMPASATRSWPVTQAASSEARNATEGAMSAATPRRGMHWSIWTNSKASACGLAITPSVAVSPGATELTVIPYLPSSRAAARVNAQTPPFDAT